MSGVMRVPEIGTNGFTFEMEESERKVGSMIIATNSSNAVYIAMYTGTEWVSVGLNAATTNTVGLIDVNEAVESGVLHCTIRCKVVSSVGVTKACFLPPPQ